MHCGLIWPLLAAAMASGQTITNFAGNGLPGYQGDNGPAIQAEVDNVAGGRGAFTLGTDRYPFALNIRGTIEFATPVGAAIGALGIRIPAGATTTYTTLPALAR
jgi:hypothetical protein